MKLVMLLLTLILPINFVFAAEQQTDKRVAILISSYGDKCFMFSKIYSVNC